MTQSPQLDSYLKSGACATFDIGSLLVNIYLILEACKPDNHPFMTLVLYKNTQQEKKPDCMPNVFQIMFETHGRMSWSIEEPWLKL